VDRTPFRSNRHCRSIVAIYYLPFNKRHNICTGIDLVRQVRRSENRQKLGSINRRRSPIFFSAGLSLV